MKKNVKIDLRRLPKAVRKAITSKRNDDQNALITDVAGLLSKETIGQEEFVGVFRKHETSFFTEKGIDSGKISFKNDGTPNLRSVPKKVREVFRSFYKTAEQKKVDYIMGILFDNENITQADIDIVQNICKKNAFQEKWQREFTVY